MRIKRSQYKNVFERWSYIASILCYVIFLSMIWGLAVPLKSSVNINDNLEMFAKQKLEETFEIKIRNSNFNSDKMESEYQLLSDKNEYLVNLNEHGNGVHASPDAVLHEVFLKADKDRNKKLDSRELSQWIRRKIMEHITIAVGNNFALFSLIDINPKNGVITWKEYHSYFLKKRGFNEKYIYKHDERRHKGLQRTIKEQIMRDKASWREAAKSDPDSLTVEEFLAFTHPESSSSNHLILVDELYEKFDTDGDEILTEEEFAILQQEVSPGDDNTLVIRQDENQRRAEFRKSVDLNGDGKADRRELLHYVAPQSPRHSEHEAEALLALADTDHDNMLSLPEILAHPDLFLKSKMVDTAQSFHDEF